MKKYIPRFLSLIFCTLIFSACQSPSGGTTPTATVVPATETPVPATPTKTPTPTETRDPLSSIDLQNPATYPDWMSYFTRGEFPSVEAQKSMSADMFTLYRNLLTDRGVDGVEAMNDSQVFFMAGQIANQEGWNLPANLDATRNLFVGPQAASYRTNEGGFEFGIFTNTPLVESDPVILNAHTPGEIVSNVFGENILLQRKMTFGSIIANEGILVDLYQYLRQLC